MRALLPIPSSDDDDDQDTGGHSLDSSPQDLHHALLLHEAAAIVNLHAQAVAVQNIRSLIPIVLDVSGNYAHWWVSFFSSSASSPSGITCSSTPPSPLPNLTGRAWTVL